MTTKSTHHTGQSDPAETTPLAIRLPRAGLPGGVIAVLALAAAVLLFAVLDHQRTGRPAGSTGAADGQAFLSPPPLAVPPEAPARPVLIDVQPLPRSTVPPPAYRLPTPVPSSPSRESYVPPAIIPTPPTPAPQTAPQGATDSERGRSGSSTLIIDTVPASDSDTPTPNAGSTTNMRPAGAGDDTTVRAVALSSRSDTVPVGTLIPIVLETPIDTARPGLVRAVASRDTRGFDGRRVLIPRGSRLIGEYQSDVRSGQNRVLVNWTRLIRPDGIMVKLGSPAADQLGGAGVPGRVNTFFFTRFASALLQSALAVGVEIASQPKRGSVVVGLPTGTASTIGQGLLPGSDLRPKIIVKQGAALSVFVARDLEFSVAPGR